MEYFPNIFAAFILANIAGIVFNISGMVAGMRYPGIRFLLGVYAFFFSSFFIASFYL